MQSLKIFMHSLLDYAGLFPPAKLSLQESLKNFAEYHSHEYKNWLGKFILPTHKIDELVELLKKQNYFSAIGQKAQFSVILSQCKNLSEYPISLQKDIQSLNYLLSRFANSLEIISFELLPPKEIQTCQSNKLINEFLSILSDKFSFFKSDTEFYCELSFEKNMATFIESIEEHNKENKHCKVAVKIRTGGVSPEQIPTAKQISETIFLCAKKKMMLKATAGLHVPIPNHNPQVGATLHGFLNIFSSMLLCYDQYIDIQEMEKIISSYTYTDFKFSESGLHIGNKFISNQNISFLRNNYVKSFGTCSFLEPIGHLTDHNFLN